MAEACKLSTKSMDSCVISHGIGIPAVLDRSGGELIIETSSLENLYPKPENDPRATEALRLARVLFYEAKGEEAESPEELRRAGLLPGGPWIGIGEPWNQPGSEPGEESADEKEPAGELSD